MGKNRNDQIKEYEDPRLPPCTYAPEWAEHARFYQGNEPCDDGRVGQPLQTTRLRTLERNIHLHCQSFL